MDTIEAWRPVLSHPGLYEVSSLGRVRTVARIISRGCFRNLPVPARILVNSRVRGGNAGQYLRVMLTAGGKRHAYVHMLVCEAFYGARPTPEHQACHRDDDADNNTAENLYWGTRADNDHDRYVVNAATCDADAVPF